MMGKPTLNSTLRSIIGGTARRLEKGRGLVRVRDLLDYLPRTYLQPDRSTPLHELPLGEDVVFVAEVRQAVTRPLRNRRGRMLIADVADDAGTIVQLTFFKPYGHEKRLTPGTRVVCHGQLSIYRNRLQLTHPDYAVRPSGSELPLTGDSEGDASAAEATPGTITDIKTGRERQPPRHGDTGPGQRASGSWLFGRLLPIYPSIPGVSAIVHGDSLDLVLHALADIDDPIPGKIRMRHKLPSLLEAYCLVHRPQTEADHRRGRWRLKFQEAFVIQAALAQARARQINKPAQDHPPVPDRLVDALLEKLPFQLTDGQARVLEEIRTDLARSVPPMHRLLQGEVGSGKTVVALLAMLTVADGGGQAGLLAPTEVLAAQHYRAITGLLGPLAGAGMLGAAEKATKVVLLTGSQSAAERREALAAAATGEAGIVIGTHALIQDEVEFAELDLVVIDEQHRFGVEQREALRAKSDLSPHVLVMTATPIPRTIAMTVYGDMETSVMRELPPGRGSITTHVVTGDRDSWVQRTWERVAEEVENGGRVYVVCPRIGSEDDPDLPGAADVAPGLPITVPESRSEPRTAARAGPAQSSGSGAANPESAAPGEVIDLFNPSPDTGGSSGAGTEVTPEAELSASAEAELDLDGTDLRSADDGVKPSPLHGVHQVARALRQNPATRDLQVGLLHGRMSGDEKDAAMADFAAGRTPVLVATTVIEVGVDVPSATAMVVLDADRFGISQLHQLRGRIARGGSAGLCLLMAQGTAVDPKGVERLHQVASTTDGFELATLDLATRREGDVLGATQSGGRRTLRFLQLARDEDLILTAREEARAIVEADPGLAAYPGLRAELSRLDAERTAYLERS